ncbi:MAG TPA: SurA N-terminal domain-containing protein [Candidatus Cybelea sp.]|nr:SurA N-terminal domain-containing protein [Candidatus Cybelea sp.]
MLAAMRKGAGTWVARIFLFVLVLSFGVWGVGDFIRGAREVDVATVGSTKISASTFEAQFRHELQLMQQQLRGAIDTEQAKKLGMVDTSLRQMIARSLIDQDAARMRLAVSNQVVAEEIRSNPAFRDSLGKFDRFTFERAIASQGWNEATFANVVRSDFARGAIAGGLTAGFNTAPASIVDALYGYRDERRVAEIIAIKPDALGAVADADAATLDAYYKAHVKEFMAPEYRALHYISLTPDAVVGEVQVSDADIKDEYEAEKDKLNIPEKRSVEQIILADEAAAKAAYDKLRGGMTFAAVAEQTLKQQPTSLGSVTQSQLPPELGAAAFKLGNGEVTAPLKDAFGWHIAHVTAIEPGVTQSLDSVKEKLRSSLALRGAADVAYRKFNAIQDELAGGATLEQAADKVKLKVAAVPAVDAQGQDEAGHKIANLPAAENFLQSVFEAPVGGDPQTLDSGEGNYFVFRVDSSTPPAERPLAAVRDKVMAAWKTEAGSKAATVKAKEIADKLRAGGDMAGLAKSVGTSVLTTKPMTRAGDDADATVSPQLLAALFKAKQGDVVTAGLGAEAGEAGETVARLAKIVPAQPDAKAREQLTRQIGNAMANDVAGEYQAALEKELGVTINRDVLDKLF